MSDLYLDPLTHDVAVENGDLRMVEELDAIIQHVKQRLLTFRGEWFLDLTAGLPYYQEVLKKAPNPRVVEGVFQAEIIQTPGILELTAFEMDLNRSTRKLTVDFKARATDGPVVIEDLALGV